MKKEIWNSVKGYEGLYEVSNIGNVKSFDRLINNKYKSKSFRKGKQLKLCINNKGYIAINLYKDKRTTKMVHRLVMEAFSPNYNNKPCINHIDGNKTNNRLENLEWCTSSENNIHAFKIGVRTQKHEHNSMSKINMDKALEIRSKYIPKVYNLKMLADEYGLSFQNISKIIQNKRWV